MIEYVFLVRMKRQSTGSLIKLKVRATCVDHAEAIAYRDMPKWEVLQIVQVNP